MHDGLSLVVDNLVAAVHLFNDAGCIGIVARWLATQQESAYLSVAQPHGEIGIAVVGQILFHAYLGITEIFLLLINAVGATFQVGAQIAQHSQQVKAVFHTWIFLIAAAVDIDGFTAEQEGFLIQVVDVTCVAASELLIDGLIEFGQILGFHLLSIVLQ